jgi:hypothetical protein
LTFLVLIVAGGVEGEFTEKFPDSFVDDPAERASSRGTWGKSARLVPQLPRLDLV